MNDGDDGDSEEIDEDVLKVKDPEAYHEMLMNNEAVVSKLMVKKPVLNLRKDYDERVLNTKLVVPFVEDKLKIDNYILKAQANPLKPISFSGTLINE